LHKNSPGLRFLNAPNKYGLLMGVIQIHVPQWRIQNFVVRGMNKIYWVDIKKLVENTYTYLHTYILLYLLQMHYNPSGWGSFFYIPPWTRYVLSHSLLLENLPCRFYKFDINYPNGQCFSDRRQRSLWILSRFNWLY